MIRYVGFLRAVNTPGRNVKMARIRSALDGIGLDNVATFIASGNVVFDTDDSDGLRDRIEEALLAEVGWEIPTYLRTEDEVLAIAAVDPFGGVEDFEVSFLPDWPDPAGVTSLQATVGPNDRLAVIEREVFWWTGGSRAGSPHSESLVMRTLGMPTTRRAIRTVRRIADRYLR